MLAYLLAVIFAWISWKIVNNLQTWWNMRVSVRSIPLHPDVHWFFGINHKINNLDDLVQLGDKFIHSRPLKWYINYFYFLHPVVYPVHPDTVRAIVTTSGVPKNHTTTGVYRLFKPWLGDGLLVSNGTKWERNRRLLTPAFHFDILRPYVQIFGETTDIFLDNLYNNNKSIDVFPLVSRLTLHNMLRCTLSYDDETIQDARDEHPYVAAINKLKYLLLQRFMKPYLLFDWIFQYSQEGREFHKHCDFIHGFSEKVIQNRKQALKEDESLLEKRYLDFLDILLTAQDPDGTKLTDSEIRDEVDTFMFEGHDTTASAISWALHSLAKYPEYQHRVREEVNGIYKENQRIIGDDLSKLSFTTCFIKESMRMYPPVPAFTRILKEPITIDGVELMKGQPVEIFPQLLHHNPIVWENHKEFQPERFLQENLEGKSPYAFLPFSAGQRNCIGQHFAMNEIKVVLSRVVQRFEIKLDPERVAMPFPELILGAKDGIYLTFTELNTKEFQPQRFLPENLEGKSPYAFLPFSAGQRNCIGQHFAMNEIKVVLSRVVKRFEIKLDPERVALPFPELILGAKDGIYLNFTELSTKKLIEKDIYS